MEQIKAFDFKGNSWIFVHTPERSQHDELKFFLTQEGFDTHEHWGRVGNPTYDSLGSDTTVWITAPSNKIAGLQSVENANQNKKIKLFSYEEFIEEYFKPPISLENIINDLDSRIQAMERRQS